MSSGHSLSPSHPDSASRPVANLAAERHSLRDKVESALLWRETGGRRGCRSKFRKIFLTNFISSAHCATLHGSSNFSDWVFLGKQIVLPPCSIRSVTLHKRMTFNLVYSHGTPGGISGRLYCLCCTIEEIKAHHFILSAKHLVTAYQKHRVPETLNEPWKGWRSCLLASAREAL